MMKYFNYPDEIRKISLTKRVGKSITVFIDKKSEIPTVNLKLHDERHSKEIVYTKEVWNKILSNAKNIVESFARLESDRHNIFNEGTLKVEYINYENVRFIFTF